jgi:shikimate dehydrogenase
LSELPAEYGVIGHPVAHSRSPFIHGLFAQQTRQNMIYRLHDVSPEDLAAFVMAFWRRGGKGLNVTVPHKIGASGMVRAMSERATRAGAVNTLLMDEDGITGDNTDGAGLVRDLTGPLLDESPELITIAGRSAARAAALGRQFAAFGPVQGHGLDAVASGAFDIVINATSAGLAGEAPAIPASVLTHSTFCYDMSYAKAGTAFLQWARDKGCKRSAQGWGMLVEQAAESFELWRGVRPATAGVLAVLVSGSS